MNKQAVFLELTQHVIVLMGISFILGSLFTIFILLILDMMRAARLEEQALHETAAADEENHADAP